MTQTGLPVHTKSPDSDRNLDSFGSQLYRYPTLRLEEETLHEDRLDRLVPALVGSQ